MAPAAPKEKEHSNEGRCRFSRLLAGRHPIHVADRISQVALTAQGTWIEAVRWKFDQLPAGSRALFACVPTVNKAAVAAVIGAADAAVVQGQELATLLAGYAGIHRAA